MAKGFPDAMRLLAAGVSEPAATAPFHYSDTGFIVLAELVRRVSGQPLDRFTHARLYQPLGMRETTFNPPASWRARIAPTEFSQGQMLRGVVHDPRARELHGVAGHAGLNGAGGSKGGRVSLLPRPQKLETTAVKTSLMVAGLLAEYSAPFEASAIRRSVAVSASWP
jgi:CubicO group peptidase (beta-lactamase class C family)